MELRDLAVTPIILVLILSGAFLIRPYFTDEKTRKYFLPALVVRIVSAILVGAVYQFYYNGGDTFNYHTYGSRIIWEAFINSPADGLKLIFNDGYQYEGVYQYASRIVFFNDPASYSVVRLAAIFDLITFSTYTSTAALFACLSFLGSWLLFQTFYSMYSSLVKWLAIATLYIPSAVFWGSGILKDTITMALVGISTYLIYHIFIKQDKVLLRLPILIFSLYALLSIKIYIVMAFIPSVIFWIFIHRLSSIRWMMARVFLFPFVIGMTVVLGYLAVQKAGEDNPKYALSNLAETARITAYDIRYFTGRNAGSGYSLGELDGTWQSMARLTPEAIGVSLFRPFLWEISNPLMILSGLESLALTLVTLYVLFRCRSDIFKAMGNPNVLFCFIFSMTFAFAVGVSTYNFGTLVRYKIPLMPFYLIFLILILSYSNNFRNPAETDVTE